MKKSLKVITISLICVFCIMPSTQAKDLSLDVKSAVIVDGVTGSVLYESNANNRLAIASITKIMTAIVVLEKESLDKNIKITKDIESVGQSEIGLVRGESVSLKQLIEAMLVHSANDAAVALAKYSSGSIEKFVKEMNKKAKRLGANNTNFSNPDGLNSNNNYSTTKDLAKIARYAMKNNKFKKIVAMKKVVVLGKKTRTFESRNKLLFQYKPAIGIKTGYTLDAGYCLVSAAQKEGKYLIGVTLGANTLNNSFNEAQDLLEYGYDNYSYKKISIKNKVYKRIKLNYYDEKLPIIAKDYSGYFIKKGEKIDYKIDLSNKDKYPIQKGKKYGYIVIKSNGKEVNRVVLIAGKSFKKPTMWHKVTYYITSFFNNISNFFNDLAFE